MCIVRTKLGGRSLKVSDDAATHCVDSFLLYPSSRFYKNRNVSEVGSTSVFW
jgi:hypothetical protein